MKAMILIALVAFGASAMANPKCAHQNNEIQMRSSTNPDVKTASKTGGTKNGGKQ